MALLEAPIEIAPSAIQKTLQARVPFVKIILEPAAAVKAPSNLMTNAALLFPLPSKVTVPASDPAPPIEYTPAVIVSPLPKAAAWVVFVTNKSLRWIYTLSMSILA